MRTGISKRSIIFPSIIASWIIALSILLPLSATAEDRQLSAADAIDLSPVSIPADAAAWGRAYELIATESFDSPRRIPAPGFSLGEAGRWSGEGWVSGRSSGVRPYRCFYRSDPSSLPLEPRGTYEMRFSYRIEEELDRGFEFLFYSPTGGAAGIWIPSLVVNGAVGKTGRGTLRAALREYPDYEVRWNIVGRGAVAITDIELVDLRTGMTVARDDMTLTGSGCGPRFAFSGQAECGPDPSFAGRSSARLKAGASIRTVPEALPLPADCVLILEFDYRVIARPGGLDPLGGITLYDPADPAHRRRGTPFAVSCPDRSRFCGGVKAGDSARPYVLEFQTAAASELAISDVNVYLQRTLPRQAAENPAFALRSAPFPRLGNYQLGESWWVARDAMGTATEGLPLMATEELERRLALFDVIAGLSTSSSTADPALARRLRALNPDIVLLPYRIAHEQWVDRSTDAALPNPLADADTQFLRGIQDAWWLRTSRGALVPDPDFPAIRKLNVSPFCPPDARGRDYGDYLAESVIDLYLKDGTWDGIFFDNLFASTNIHILNAREPRKFDADYNRNGRRDEGLPWANEMTASASIKTLRAMRSRFGDAAAIVINHGGYPDLALAPLVNGFTFEIFNFAWYGWLSSDYDRFSEINWGLSLSEYRAAEARGRQPVVNIMEATSLKREGMSGQLHFTGDYRRMNPRELPVQRLALGTALLGDGFYEYDLVDNRSAPIFFDEWCVDPDGRSTDTAEGKGWLGAALGPAAELTKDLRTVAERPDRIVVGKRAAKEYRIDCGVNRSAESRQYTFDFDWRIVETLDKENGFSLLVDGAPADWALITSLVAGAEAHYRLHFTVKGGQSVSFLLYEPEVGAVAVSGMRVTAGRAGVFRRDFERGVVLVNATKERIELSPAELAGPLARRGLRRIAGRLDPQNDGRPVTGALALNAADAIVLIADRLSP